MPRRPSVTGFRAFRVDSSSDEPYHRQLYAEIRTAILDGRLASGSRLPASRELAHATRLSRNTVLSALAQLEAEGYVETRPASGTYVALTARAAPASLAHDVARDPAAAPRAISTYARRALAVALPVRRAAHGAGTFQPGLPALEQFPVAQWRRLFDRRLRRATPPLYAFGDPQGHAPLREAIARHLAATRGVRCSPGQVIVTAGAQQAIDLAARVLLEPGDRVLFEDPGYFAARAAFEAAGARVVPVPVDGDGMDAEAAIAAAPDARLAYLTPSHQNPLEVTLSLPRRVAMLAWARRSGGWILEDDNASEYRYRGRPLAAMQGIDADGRVLLAGTFSKLLFEGLRLGFLVAPPDLVPALVRARELADRQGPSIVQAVLADFMAGGHLARHVRRMCRLYARRLDALLGAVREHATGALEVHEGHGGMSRVAWLPDGVSDVEVASAARAAGFMGHPLADYRLRSGGRGGLVLGFTGMAESEIDDGVRRLAGLVRAAARARPRA